MRPRSHINTHVMRTASFMRRYYKNGENYMRKALIFGSPLFLTGIVPVQGAEENIWTQDRWSDERVEETA
jgi:hypothetical protein